MRVELSSWAQSVQASSNGANEGRRMAFETVSDCIPADGRGLRDCEYCYCGKLFHCGNGDQVLTFARCVAEAFGEPAIEDHLLSGDFVDSGLGAVVAGGLMDGYNGFGLQFGDDVLDAAFAEAGEADEVDVAAAEKAEGGLRAGLAALEHEAIDRELAGCEAVGNALDGAEPDGAGGCYSSIIYHSGNWCYWCIYCRCSSYFYRCILFYCSK